MTDQSQIDAFVERAKARLDEMGAGAKALEEQLGNLDTQVRQEAEEAVARFRQWVNEGEAHIKRVQDHGEAAFADAKAYIEKTWTVFEAQASKWVEIANNQRETFEAQAKAQLAAWQSMIDDALKRAAELQESNRAAADAEIERLKGEAGKAEAQLGELRKAGEASWAAMSTALDKSRLAFERAAEKARAEFEKATKT